MNNTLDLYSDYLIVQNKYATSTGLSEMLNGAISHDKVTRFLNKEELTSKEIWRYIKADVRSNENSEGALILDDSIEEKPYTDENEIICWHYSHAKSRQVKGVNLLSCLVNYGDISLPIGYEIVHKDIKYSDVETKKVKRKAAITKNEHFREIPYYRTNFAIMQLVYCLSRALNFLKRVTITENFFVKFFNRYIIKSIPSLTKLLILYP